MKDSNIRSVKIDLTPHLSLQNIAFLKRAAEEAREAYRRLEYLAEKHGECCPVTVLSQIVQNSLEDLTTLTRDTIFTLARKACRTLFADRATVKFDETKLILPMNKKSLSLGVKELKMTFKNGVIFCDYQFPTHFRAKYAFSRKDFEFGEIEIIPFKHVVCDAVYLKLGYEVTEAREAYPLFHVIPKAPRLKAPIA